MNTLTFEFADETNTDKLRISKDPTSNYELDDTMKNYIKSSLSIERKIDVDFEAEGNYAFYNMDDLGSETFFILKNKNEPDLNKAYISIGLRGNDYEFVANEVSFEKAQRYTVSYIDNQSIHENNGQKKKIIVHDVEKWQKYQKEFEQVKEAFISHEAAKTITFDEEITYEDEVVGFYAWATDELMKNFVPSEKRLGISDEDNNIKFFFNYKDDVNITLDLSYYKGDEQIYETYRIAPESEGYELLKFAMDAYCMEQNGQHLKDYKALDGKTPLDYMELSTIINSKAVPLFSDEMSQKVIDYYAKKNTPLYIDDNEQLYVYYKNVDDVRRESASKPVSQFTPSGVIGVMVDDPDFDLKTGDENLDKMISHLEKIRDSLEETENKERLDMLYSPLSKEKLKEFINIAELDSFNDEMAEECLKVYEGDNIPLVTDELGNVYQREMSKDLRSNTEDDLIELNPSGLIDYYKNQLEVESENRDEIWNKKHKEIIASLNDIEDYLTKIERSVELTTENAEILADYINQHKEEFGKGFTKTNGHIPCFEDMSKELAQDIIETLEIRDYFIRYDEGEKQFFIYDHQAADNSLFEEVDASTIVFKAERIADEWSRDDSTEHENEICNHLEKYLYPKESFLPVNLKIDLRIPLFLKEKWENKGHSEEELLLEIEKTMQETMLTETVVKGSGLINAEEASVTLQTSIVVKEPYFNEKLQTKEYQKEIETVLSKRFGIAIENRFVNEFRNDYKLSDRVMFKNIAAEDIIQTKERSLEELKENDKVNDISVKVENIPEWAVGYMAYGDSTGLSDKEISQIDNWMKENKLSNLSEISDERHFASHPEFGLACDCVEGTFIKMKEQEIQKVQSAESKSVSTPKEIIDSYINKVKENLSDNDKKIVEKVLLASKTSLSSFNADEKSVIGKYFLDSGVTSEDKLGKLLSKEVTKQEKQQKKDNTRKIDEGRGY